MRPSVVMRILGWVFLLAMAVGFVSSNGWLFLAAVVLAVIWLGWRLNAAHAAHSRQGGGSGSPNASQSGPED